jgi:hypothetical protein
MIYPLQGIGSLMQVEAKVRDDSPKTIINAASRWFSVFFMVFGPGGEKA